MANVFSVRNLIFREVIKYPDIDIEEGKITFIFGKSGSGKSSFLKMLNATISPSSGDIYYNGKNITDLDSVTLRKEAILVSQTVFLFEGSIEDNFKKYYEYRESPVPSKEEIERYLKICCADFDLNSRCETMSGGERQRIFISICLSFLPKVLMLDEPTSALDSSIALRLFLNLQEFCKDKGITFIVVSHDKGLAEKFADKIINLDEEAVK